MKREEICDPDKGRREEPLGAFCEESGMPPAINLRFSFVGNASVEWHFL